MFAPLPGPRQAGALLAMRRREGPLRGSPWRSSPARRLDGLAVFRKRRSTLEAHPQVASRLLLAASSYFREFISLRPCRVQGSLEQRVSVDLLHEK